MAIYSIYDYGSLKLPIFEFEYFRLFEVKQNPIETLPIIKSPMNFKSDWCYTEHRTFFDILFVIFLFLLKLQRHSVKL